MDLYQRIQENSNNYSQIGYGMLIGIINIQLNISTIINTRKISNLQTQSPSTIYKYSNLYYLSVYKQK